MKVQQCSCGVEIVMRAHTRTGNFAPIEFNSSPDGNIVILPDGTYAILTKVEHVTYRGPRHKSHFATCKHAKTFRRG